MRATKHNIILKPIQHKVLPSGIIIGTKELENPIGVVHSAGGGTEKNPMHVKDGQTVAYRSNVGIGLEYEGEKYLVLKEVHIIGILEENEC